MDKPSFKLVGAPCGHHGQYTFYKALRLTGATEKIIAIGDFFFVRVWQDSELVSIGELQLLWTDRVSDQTLVSLRLYFLPENTPEGRNLHGEDEVLAINDKVVLRADDLLSWICAGTEWRWGLRAVWRGACAPPAAPARTAPLHHTRLDFSDVASEKNSIEVDADAPGVVVFSYPRYCRYRALLARLDGLQADWLRDSLVAALGGYAAPTNNTRILYCKDTFEYPELEGHEFVCNHLAPRLKGRPRGRRRRAPHSPSPSPSPEPEPSDAENTDDMQPGDTSYPSRRRLSLRNGAPQQSEDEDDDCKRIEETAEDRAFLQQLKMFYKSRSEPFKSGHTLKHWSLRALYGWVVSRGGYEAACRRQLWRALAPAQPARARRHYERFLLPFENHERRNGLSYKLNGKIDCEPQTIATIDVTDSPLRDDDVKILRTPSPKPENLEKLEKYDKLEKFEKIEKHEKGSIDSETGEITSKDELIVKNAEELNREFLESLNKDEKVSKISVKPVDQLVEPAKVKMYEKDDKDLQYLETSKISLESASPRAPPNGHTPNDLKSSRPAGRSSLRAVRVKPQRNQPPSSTPPGSASSTSSPPAPLTNFGIHHPPPPPLDDDIVEVPYKPKTPEIIDLDEYPESPQAVKKKKLDILKERGLEVTALPPWQPHPQVLGPPLMLNPAVQHQIMTQAQLFQMYNIMPQNYGNGLQPPKVIQASSIFGTAGPEKTVYGNPKDPFMPPPHVLHGAPLKPLRTAPTAPATPQDILDLTCKSTSPPPQKPTVEIVRVPNSPSPKLAPQNLSKNYTLVDGKAVVGSNLEITLVNKAQSPNKNRPPQKRSSNGKFMSTKTPTPPKDTYPKFTSPSHSNIQKKPPITIPSYQIREDTSLQNAMKNQNLAQIMDLQKHQNLAQIMDLQKSQNYGQIMDLQKHQNIGQMLELQKSQQLAQLVEMQAGAGEAQALYRLALAGAPHARQLALYRELLAAQLHHTPTTQ